MLKKWFRKILLSSAPLWSVGSVASPQPAVDQATSTLVVSQGVDADPALWVLKDADTTIYMFGTFHFLKPDYRWFDEGVKEAFDMSDELVLELPNADPAEAASAFIELGLDRSGNPIRAKMSEAQRKTFDEGLAALGDNPARFDVYQPWYAGVTLQVEAIMRAGFNPDQGVEEQLKAAAARRNMPVIGLETYREQLQKLSTLPLAAQVEFLNSSFAPEAEYQQSLDTALGQWSKPDPDGLAQSMNAGLTDPVLREAMLTSRNKAWVEWIKQRLQKPGTAFMAVGAGHLSGDSSVPELLAKEGLVVERVAY